jgi:hypothetical protein
LILVLHFITLIVSLTGELFRADACPICQCFPCGHLYARMWSPVFTRARHAALFASAMVPYRFFRSQSCRRLFRLLATFVPR